MLAIRCELHINMSKDSTTNNYSVSHVMCIRCLDQQPQHYNTSSWLFGKILFAWKVKAIILRLTHKLGNEICSYNF